MKKVHVLGIAPYEGMKHLMRQAAARRENVELDIFIGDMEVGADIALTPCKRLCRTTGPRRRLLV